MADIKEIVDQYVADGVMTREEHEHFIELVHKDGEIDDEESQQISRIFHLIQTGELRIVDEMRDKFEAKRKKDEEALASLTVNEA